MVISPFRQIPLYIRIRQLFLCPKKKIKAPSIERALLADIYIIDIANIEKATLHTTPRIPRTIETIAQIRAVFAAEVTSGLLGERVVALLANTIAIIEKIKNGFKMSQFRL